MVGTAQVAARAAVGTVAGPREALGRAVAVMEEVDTVVVAARVGVALAAAVREVVALAAEATRAVVGMVAAP